MCFCAFHQNYSYNFLNSEYFTAHPPSPSAPPPSLQEWFQRRIFLFQSLEGGYWRKITEAIMKERLGFQSLEGGYWREKILKFMEIKNGFQSLEGGYWRRLEVLALRILAKFPILRGRLLKSQPLEHDCSVIKFPILRGRLLKKHSQQKKLQGSCFQSLEGGYFILPFRGVRL